MQTLSPQLQRLAFVQEWGDELIHRLLEACQNNGTDALVTGEKAANELALASLRQGGDSELADSAAKRLGFSAFEELQAFATANPALSIKQKAEPAIFESCGHVTSISLTEVVFSTEDGKLLAFEKAKLPDVRIGDAVRSAKYGRMSHMGTTE